MTSSWQISIHQFIEVFVHGPPYYFTYSSNIFSINPRFKISIANITMQYCCVILYDILPLRTQQVWRQPRRNIWFHSAINISSDMTIRDNSPIRYAGPLFNTCLLGQKSLFESYPMFKIKPITCILETSKIIVCLAVKTQYTRYLFKRFTLFPVASCKCWCHLNGSRCCQIVGCLPGSMALIVCVMAASQRHFQLEMLIVLWPELQTASTFFSHCSLK